MIEQKKQPSVRARGSDSATYNSGAREGGRLRAVVIACAFVLGAVLMAFEMLASRYLTPYFGSGINTWAVLISIVLLAMALGYFIGGSLVDRFPTLRLAALFTAIATVWFVVVPMVATELLESVMMRFESEVVGALIAAGTLVLWPVMALGTYSPIAVRLLIVDIHASGRNAGLIYGISTLGNIVGTLGAALVIIPNFGTRASTYGLAVVSLLCAGVLWWAASRWRVGP